MTKKKKREIKIGKISDRFIRWIGSQNSLLVHTIFFMVMLTLPFLEIDFEKIMLILTTVVSLEAIYLAIFIQMTINKQSQELKEVSKDIDEIQEDVDEIQEDIDEIQEDVDEIQKDETKEKDTEIIIKNNRVTLTKIEEDLGKLVEEIIDLKNNYKNIEDKVIKIDKSKK